MIRREDLQEAIAECEGQRNPNANTCLKLAAYHVIMDHMDKDELRIADPVLPTYSRQGKEGILYDGDSDFARAVSGMQVEDLMPIMDELMSTIEVLNPRLYNGVMRRIDNI